MSKQDYLFCLVIVFYTHLKIFNAAIIPLRPLIPSTSTYKPSTLLLPPGFDSQKPPRQPMLYPYAVSSSGISTRPRKKSVLSTTPGWIPVALNVKSDLPLIPASLYSTTPSRPVPALEDRISNDEPKYSSPSYKEGPVFESIVYGTWKPDPPLQPLKILNVAKQQQQHANSSNIGGLIVDNGRAYNKSINRQHGGFIGNIQQRPPKVDKRTFSSPTSHPINSSKSNEFMEMSSETRLQRKVKKQGRRKIRPIFSIAEQNSIEKSSNKEEVTTTKENIQHEKNVIEVNLTVPKLVEVAKPINESIEIKYNHKQTSTHSIDVITTADANNDDDDYADKDKLNVSNTPWPTILTEFFSTVPEIEYDDDTDAEIYQNISATPRSWPTDFIEEPLTTTEKVQANDSVTADPSEIPLALSALNIPPSLWPKLPGNITKLGHPYEAESSAEEPALCVPITVREQNIMSSNELVYIERIYCFPMPPSSTTSENKASTFESIFTSSTTLKTVTTAKVQNFHDFIDSNSRLSQANSIWKNNSLLASILVIYFKFI